MDRWLTAIQQDHSGASLPSKVIRDKPPAAMDACWVDTAEVTDHASCSAAFPYFSLPRFVAGMPFDREIVKCTLKPLNRADYLGFGVVFTDSQWAALNQAFPAGVCDYSKLGVGEAGADRQPWLTFAGGPGGTGGGGRRGRHSPGRTGAGVVRRRFDPGPAARRRVTRRLTAALLTAAALAGCGAAGTSTPGPGAAATLLIEGPHGVLLHLSVQIASSPEARDRGLMGVTHLSDTAGMVFAFPSSTETAFWMKDTLIPLDIAFWDAAGTIVDVRTMQPCTRDPCPLYVARGAYRDAVEVAAGLLERSGVRPGDRVSLGA